MITIESPTRWVSNYAPPPREGNCNKHRGRAETRVCLSPPYPHSGLYRHTFVRIGTYGIHLVPQSWLCMRTASLALHETPTQLVLPLPYLYTIWMSLRLASTGVIPTPGSQFESLMPATKSRLSHTLYRAYGALHAIIPRSSVVGRSSRIVHPKLIQIHQHRLASVLTDEI